MKIGLLGGSFDPPHFGHVGISQDALEILKLEQIWWLPTKQNPLKERKNSDFTHRIKLCLEITKNCQNIIIKNDELALESCYFIDILLKISQKYPDNQFYLLIGADNLINFHLWHKWQDILKLSKLVVFERENYNLTAKNSKTALFCQELLEKTGKKHLIFLQNQKYNISSTKLRNKINEL